ncbi:MAG: hypothetical protein KBT04_06755 [Bacteroidales bacterium]|nr:hypothetical protein [Candidatus Colimorpha onthohippi]
MTQNDVKFTVEGKILKVQAQAMTSQSIRAMVMTAAENDVKAIDFSGVETVYFSALRELLTVSRLTIINTNQDTYERMRDTGVDVFHFVSPAPIALDKSNFTAASKGVYSSTYFSNDGEAVAKLYDDEIPAWVICREKTLARSMSILGVNTPLTGTLCSIDGHLTLLYERVHNKKSVSRAIAENSNEMEKYTAIFTHHAMMMHQKQCDTNIFINYKSRLRGCILESKRFDWETRENMLNFLNSVPDTNTFVHGAMEPSNLIFSDNKYQWIDIANCAYGSPMFDCGMMYFQCHAQTPEMLENIFHLTQKQMDEMWAIFCREYFSATSEEQIKQVDAMLKPYAALTMFYMGHVYGYHEHLISFIKNVF